MKWDKKVNVAYTYNGRLCRFKKGRQFCHLHNKYEWNWRTQKHKCFLIHFDDKSVGVEFIKPESGIVVYGLCGGGKTEVLFKGFKVSIVQDQLVLEICRMM